jgi:hypothetical protein
MDLIASDNSVPNVLLTASIIAGGIFSSPITRPNFGTAASPSSFFAKVNPSIAAEIDSRKTVVAVLPFLLLLLSNALTLAASMSLSRFS